MKNILFRLLFISGIFSLPQKSNSQNLLNDGSFSTTTSLTPYYTDPPPLNLWCSWTNYSAGASFTTDVQNGVCSYLIDNPGYNLYDVQLIQWGFPLILGHHYRLSFDVKADADRDFGVFIGQNGPPWTNLNTTYIRHATSGWQTITIEFDAFAVFPLHKLSFEMGAHQVNMYFANINLTDLGPIPVNKVVIAGTFQSELGCSGDWKPDCDNTALTYNSATGLWTGSFNIPAGCYQYQATINESYYNTYGENGDISNIWLYVPEQTLITFTYNPATHITETSPIAGGFSTSCLPQVVLTGSFQQALGCSNNWEANCPNTALTFNGETGLFENDFSIPPGIYNYRVILNNDWYGNNFGVNGKPFGNDYTINISCDTRNVHFTYDPLTHIVTNNLSASTPNTVVVAGSFQSEVGCSGDWQPDCDNTRMHYDPNYGAWVTDPVSIPAGQWEYKITINNSWGENYGQYGQRDGANIPLVLCAAARVRFIYNDCYHYTYEEIVPEQPNTVVVAGSFQSELGCTGDWQPDCDNTLMHYDPNYGAWVTDPVSIPAGQWEYKFTVNNSWDENYGQYGQRNGPNISLNLCTASTVVFTFSYQNCYVYSYEQIVADQPNTVVIAGTFQSELGCAADWAADCDNTRMQYNPDYGAWMTTLDIPAGHWEYKWAINDSWDQNYGQNGQPNGPAITLDLCYPARVVFTFYHNNCNGYGYAQIITNGVCVYKFYDANTNGYPDDGEEPMGDVSFTLTGNGITQMQTTGSDGKAAFTNLTDGVYEVKENVPAGYVPSGTDMQYAYVFGGAATLYFGNVCLGAGSAKGTGFWTSRQGEETLIKSGRIENLLGYLRYYSLRNADGSDFDPYTYDQLKRWMLGVNAKNMTYMLSVQLAAMVLNIELGYVNYNSSIYTPGCSWWGNLMNVSNLTGYTDYYLSYRTTVDGKDPDRDYLECLKNAFDNALNNLTFVQPHPCNSLITVSQKRPVQEINEIEPLGEAKLWPNPSNNYFTLRPANKGSNEAVQLKVYNMNGQMIYAVNGFSNKDYRFGEGLTPGIYMAEFIQGNKRTTFKLVKQ